MRSEQAMSNQEYYEQTLYIGPEENITDVRERLAYIPAQSIILVIPARTALRGHIIWKLLRTHAEELGKDICIVSADPQVCAIARSVHFKVAQHQTRVR